MLSVLKKLFVLLLSFSLALTSCASRKMYKYYSDTSNYIEVTGTVEFINYTASELYLGFDMMLVRLSDNSFKIVGENLSIAKKNGIRDKLKMGTEATFITAPRYFGDGYVMPIVAISVDGENLLEFEEGYENLLLWLQE